MSIITLPPELLTKICGYLELSDWCALRITCHQTHSKSLEAFAKRYYKSLSLLVPCRSLDRLEEIAAHDLFRTSIQEIWDVSALCKGWHKMDFSDFASSEFGKKSKKGWNGTKAELEARFAAY